MSHSCNRCKKYHQRPLCGDCGHRCCGDSDRHSTGRREPKKDCREPKKDCRESKKDCRESKKIYYSPNQYKCGCDLHCKKEEDCYDYRKPPQCGCKKSKECKRHRNKCVSDFSVKDFDRFDHNGEVVGGDQNGYTLLHPITIDPNRKGKTSFYTVRDTKFTNKYPISTVTLCDRDSKCVDVVLRVYTMLKDEEEPDCGNVKYELCVTRVQGKCNEVCSYSSLQFVRSPKSVEDGACFYEFTFCNILTGKDKTILSFQRKEIGCENKCGGEYVLPTYVGGACIYE